LAGASAPPWCSTGAQTGGGSASPVLGSSPELAGASVSAVAPALVVDAADDAAAAAAEVVGVDAVEVEGDAVAVLASLPGPALVSGAALQAGRDSRSKTAVARIPAW